MMSKRIDNYAHPRRVPRRRARSLRGGTEPGTRGCPGGRERSQARVRQDGHPAEPRDLQGGGKAGGEQADRADVRGRVRQGVQRGRRRLSVFEGRHNNSLVIERGESHAYRELTTYTRPPRTVVYASLKRVALSRRVAAAHRALLVPVEGASRGAARTRGAGNQPARAPSFFAAALPATGCRSVHGGQEHLTEPDQERLEADICLVWYNDQGRRGRRPRVARLPRVPHAVRTCRGRVTPDPQEMARMSTTRRPREQHARRQAREAAAVKDRRRCGTQEATGRGGGDGGGAHERRAPRSARRAAASPSRGSRANPRAAAAPPPGRPVATHAHRAEDVPAERHPAPSPLRSMFTDWSCRRGSIATRSSAGRWYFGQYGRLKMEHANLNAAPRTPRLPCTASISRYRRKRPGSKKPLMVSPCVAYAESRVKASFGAPATETPTRRTPTPPTLGASSSAAMIFRAAPATRGRGRALRVLGRPADATRGRPRSRRDVRHAARMVRPLRGSRETPRNATSKDGDNSGNNSGNSLENNSGNIQANIQARTNRGTTVAAGAVCPPSTESIRDPPFRRPTRPTPPASAVDVHAPPERAVEGGARGGCRGRRGPGA